MASSISAGTTSSTALVATADTTGALVLQTNNGTTALTLSAAQVATFAGTAILPTTLGVGSATPATSGAGITFPATQSASTDANTLDDYEEGTWTPNVQNTSSSSTFSAKTGRYTKIGRFVYCSFVCDGGNSGTAGGALVVSGLPFTYGGTSNVPTLTGFTANGLASTEYVTSRTQNGSTSFSITTVQGPTITVQLSFASGTIVYEV
jgi:hypothetical protein